MSETGSQALAGKRVLILEDEYFIATDLAQALAAAGAEIMGPYSTSASALTSIEANPPDMGVLDVNLAGVVNFDLADSLAARDVPFVFASGYDDTSVPQRHSTVPFYQKPLTGKDVLQVLLDVTAVKG